MGLLFLKVNKLLQKDKLLLTAKSPVNPDTHFIKELLLRREDEHLNQSWRDFVAINTASLDLESLT